MKKTLLIIFAIITFGTGWAQKTAATLKCDNLVVTIDEAGCYSSIRVCGQEILLNKGRYPVVTITGKGMVMPKYVEHKGYKLTFHMTNGDIVRLATIQSKNSITFEVLECPEDAFALSFGPVAVDIDEMVGEIVGVSQGGGIAFGMMGLNAKSVAGLPQEHATEIYRKLAIDPTKAFTPYGTLEPYQLAATHTDGGAVHQLSCQNRSRLRTRHILLCDNALAYPIDGSDAQITGSKFALFGCRSSEALERIGRIEQEHGLPHPTLDGEWCKTNRCTSNSYLICDYEAADMDMLLDKCDLAGWKRIDHPDPFESWGHYEWKRTLAHSDAEMRQLADKAALRKVALGASTHSALISTNDAYITPIPSEHLLPQRELTLQLDIDRRAQSMSIDLAAEVCSEPATSMKAVMIDEEIMTYKQLQHDGYGEALKGCTRGAYDTKAMAHKRNTVGYRLWDYKGMALLPDMHLQDIIGRRLSELANHSGIGQLNFESLEACSYGGQDSYATARFVSEIWKGCTFDIGSTATTPNHYLWHLHSHNGTTPSSGSNEKMTEEAAAYQDYCQRNLLPCMIGTFEIHAATATSEASTMEELEWMLGKAAAFDGGYAISCTPATLRRHGEMDEMLNTIRMWDDLRRANGFGPQARELLSQSETTCRLEEDEVGDFWLTPLYISKTYTLDLGKSHTHHLLYPMHTAPIEMRIRVAKGTLDCPTISTPTGSIRIEGKATEGQYLILDKDGDAYVTDADRNKIAKAPTAGRATMPQGENDITISSNKNEIETTIEVQYIMPQPRVRAKIKQ